MLERVSDLMEKDLTLVGATAVEDKLQQGAGHEANLHIDKYGHVSREFEEVASKKPLKYSKNYMSTTKYNVITFLPKALFEQFRRVANIYFLLAVMLSVTPLSPFSAYSMITPLTFVIGLSMTKEVAMTGISSCRT
ncbi:ATPase E1-E2 type family protein / haloacid dehalogenase-like hydrolase family protein [Artemisia annua]|uniref:ATPase E1-E2 type family protein / haloacid dehalogenase-like hydrolase family protein n=1 Tax=Artemisia annua TaxID=35608 RepID=A0A2U1KIW6_ARTAN|nr:ATPase E1-E2 type family protein / haloacid dehalogenase-like hydrolase family protein [Artemisia annua]